MSKLLESKQRIKSFESYTVKPKQNILFTSEKRFRLVEIFLPGISERKMFLLKQCFVF